MNLLKVLGIKSKEEEGELKRKETPREEETEMAGLRTRALAMFEEDVERRKVHATAYFKNDFGTDPDEITYLGNWKFLFRANGLHIRGYIEWWGDYLYCKSYRLAAPCREPHCERLVIDKENFFKDLVGLGKAINEYQGSQTCEVCMGVLAD